MIYMHQNVISRHPLRTDADTDADPRGEVFGPRYDSDMLMLVGVYQYCRPVTLALGQQTRGKRKTIQGATPVIMD